MGICISTNRSSSAGDETPGTTTHAATASPEQRRSRSLGARPTGLSSRPPSPPEAMERELPYGVGTALSAYVDATSLGRLAMTSRSATVWLPEALGRIESIAAAVVSEIEAFSNPAAQGLSGTSPALRRIGELPPDRRAQLLETAVSRYVLQFGGDGDEAIVASRSRFGELCNQVQALPRNERFTQLVSGLARDALAETYHTGQQWNMRNTIEPLRQVLPLIAALPKRERHSLANYLRSNVIHLIRPADRNEAVIAINRAVGHRRRGNLCGAVED